MLELFSQLVTFITIDTNKVVIGVIGTIMNVTYMVFYLPVLLGGMITSYITL
jgi:hypothetical protein